MASISCKDAARTLLAQCLAGHEWDPALIVRLASSECSDALFRILVEGLADRFEPKLCDDYAAIFSIVLECTSPDLPSYALYERYNRVRKPRVCTLDPRRVVVLSRVTIGADIAITSVILEAVKSRFPDAAIYLAGIAKAHELFAEDPRILHLDAPYPRAGTLEDRLATWRHLRSRLSAPDTVVIDPDSRLTQLGLLPVCEESDYFFFESRAYGEASELSLTQLARLWVAQTFGIPDAQPYIAPTREPLVVARPCVTVSLGVGGNAEKQLTADFEAALIRLLCGRFATVIVDRGFGAEEFARVDRAIAGTSARTFEGGFARFASLISQSDCYVGYDSAGQHAAAACGIPLVTLFKGFASDRMFARWQPTGTGPKQVLKIDGSVDVEEVGGALDALA